MPGCIIHGILESEHVTRELQPHSQKPEHICANRYDAQQNQPLGKYLIDTCCFSVLSAQIVWQCDTTDDNVL